MNPTSTNLALAASVGLAAGSTTYAVHLRSQLARAQKDALTGLLTRQPWQQKAAPIIARGALVLLADVDRFKVINDTLGHAAGDQVLQVCAARLVSWCAHDVAVTGRLGGDEFVAAVLLPEHLISQRIDALNTSLSAPVPGISLAVSVSIGWAAPTPGAELVALLHAADRAMYEAKAAHRGQQQKQPDPEAATGAGRRRWSWRGTRRQTGRGPVSLSTPATLSEVAA